MSTADITLNITRARISSTKCCISSCNNASKLHRISKIVRHEIMKTKRFFIPQKSLACDLHCDYSIWSEILIPTERCSFTAFQIEEMVDLLRLNSKLAHDGKSGSYTIILIQESLMIKAIHSLFI